MAEAGEETAANDEMTWNDFTIPQLKEELNVRGLETTGKKADLVARLEKYDSEMMSQQKPDDPDGDEFVVWNADEDTDPDVEYAGGSNGKKEDDENVATGSDKQSGADKTVDEKASKEPEPEFSFMPSKDRDLMYLMWAGNKIPIPFRDEVQKDLKHAVKQQNIIMYPVHIRDLFSDELRPLIESAINVSTELDETIPGQPIKGYLRLKFGSVREAEHAVALVKTYRPNDQELMVKHFAEDDSEGHVLSKILKEDGEHRGQLLNRLLYVGNLPSDVTEETVKEHFPDALRVILPFKEDSTEKLGYAYLEYASEAETAEAVQKYHDVELASHKLYVIRSMTERMLSFGLLKDSLRKYWLEQIRSLDSTKSKSKSKTPREQEALEVKLNRMKRRIKKDNQRREQLCLPVPETEIVEVPDSDEEKEKEKEKEKEGDDKEDKSKDEKKSPEKRSAHREIKSADRRRSSPLRRRYSPPRFRGGFRGGSRGGFRGGPSGYGMRDGGADRLVDQLQELVGALAHRERGDYGGGYSSRGGRGGYYDAPPRGRAAYGGSGGYRGDYPSSGSRYGGKRPADIDYGGDRKRHADGGDYPHYGGGRGGSYRGSYSGGRHGGPYY